MEFGEKIRFLRKKNKLSQLELGRRVGVSNRAVSKWERGESKPATDTLLSVAAAFGVNLDYFLNDNVKEKNPLRRQSGMESLRALYRIGKGPSSSHTMAPARAAQLFRSRFSEASSFRVVLMGSLAKTGKALRTDVILQDAFFPTPCEIEFNIRQTELVHPNTMHFFALQGKKKIGFWEVYSTGGGGILVKDEDEFCEKRIYPLKTFSEICEYCKRRKMRLWQYVEEIEGRGIWDFLGEIWRQMQVSIEHGLRAEGELYGGLGVLRKAKFLYHQNHKDEEPSTRMERLVCAYAYAVSEENAAGSSIVTAPTCGSCGVLPSVLRFASEKRAYCERDILHALATAGLMGNLIKTNASISGAECGCQAEIGSACAMAAAALAELYHLELNQIEYAAEIALEHHLGLTCDPVRGLVQIPCIERNAVAAVRAINAVNLANFLTDSRKISFDLVVQTMYETGRDLPHRYRETGDGGLAKLYME